MRAPADDDWGKLKRALTYLKGTRCLKSTLSDNDLSIIKWWIDVSYTTDEYCKGHTGSTMSLKKGLLLADHVGKRFKVRVLRKTSL